MRTFALGGSLASDSTPLRLPAARADHVATLYAGLRVDRAYAQQRFLLDITSTARRYARLSFPLTTARTISLSAIFPATPPRSTRPGSVLHSAQLALEWNLRRNVALTASLQRQRQSSTDPTVQFEARIASLGASARF